MGTAPDPFSNFSGGIKSEDIQAEDRLRIAIVGPPKSGKSWFAATAPGPSTIFDFDNRWASLEGKPGLYVVQNASMLQVETTLSIMKANKAKGLPLPATTIFDTVTWMEKAMEKEGFRQNKDFYRVLQIANVSMKIRAGWDAINVIKAYTNYLIEEFGALTNIIFVFHEKDERDYDKSTLKEAAYTGKLTVAPQYLAPSLSLFNEVFRITVNGAKQYSVDCRPTWDFNASTTLLVDDKEPPNLLDMIAKHKQKRAALKAAQKP